MRLYTFPKWFKRFYRGAIWDFFLVKHTEKTIYLTFDDGPNPVITLWILNLLKKHDAKGTFFCLGQNVHHYQELYLKIINDGHQVGNHSFSHLKGLFTSNETYLADIKKAQKLIKSSLFRPPYGKMRTSQFKAIQELGLTTIFWSYISYDFDSKLKSKTRLKKTLKAVKDGSIVVFHDSDKAFPQLKKELPQLMEKWSKEGYVFKSIRLPKIHE